MQLLTWIAELLSVLSFVVFVIFATVGFRQRAQDQRAQSTTTVKDIQPQAALSDLAKLAEALAKLAESLGKFAESLAKAGPAIAALVSSIVFLLIALAAVGLSH